MIKLLILLFACVALTMAQFGPPNYFGRPPQGGFGRPGQGGFGRPGQGGFGRPGQGGFGPGSGGRPPGGNIGGGQDNCPSICPAIFMPTCGFNGVCYKNFGNSCELGAAACTGRGNFRQVPVSECSRPGVRTCP